MCVAKTNIKDSDRLIVFHVFMKFLFYNGSRNVTTEIDKKIIMLPVEFYLFFNLCVLF